MIKIKRLKSTLLTQQDDLWYEKEQPYNGIIFFDKGNYQLKSYWVENGRVTDKYRAICQGELPSPIQIDCSAFENTVDNSNCQETDYHVQAYQEKPYEGIGYRFENGICIEEAYYNLNGYKESSFQWDNKDYSLVKADYYMISLADYRRSVSQEYDSIPQASSSVYATYGKEKEYYFNFSSYGTSFMISFNEDLSINDISGDSKYLLNKKYLELPFELPIFNALENYSPS